MLARYRKLYLCVRAKKDKGILSYWFFSLEEAHITGRRKPSWNKLHLKGSPIHYGLSLIAQSLFGSIGKVVKSDGWGSAKGKKKTKTICFHVSDCWKLKQYIWLFCYIPVVYFPAFRSVSGIWLILPANAHVTIHQLLTCHRILL